MTIVFKSFGLALGLLCSGHALAINKCTGPDGKVAFQDAPCPGKSEVLNIKANTGPSQSSASPAVDWRAKGAESDRRSQIQAAMERREPMVGMTTEQLVQAMGNPQKINTGDYQSGSRDQLIYERGGRTFYVYTAGNMVTAVQTSATVGGGARQVVCPSALEIRNAETSASSITLSDAVRLDKLSEIRAMRSCVK